MSASAPAPTSGVRVFVSYARTSLAGVACTINGEPAKDVVHKLAKHLEEAFGIEVWLDATDLWSGNVLLQLAEAIEGADLFICILTEEYAEKVNEGPETDWCQREFMHAAKHRAGAMVPVVASKKLLDQKKWTGLVEIGLGGFPIYFDFTRGFIPAEVVELKSIIDDMLKPQNERPVRTFNAIEQAKVLEVFKLSSGFNPLRIAQQKAINYHEGTRSSDIKRVKGWFPKRWRRGL